MTSRKNASRKRSYHHGNLRPALIRIALRIVADEGVTALTLRKVAQRAGVSHTAPYRHFPDKEALLAAVAEEGFRGLVAAVAARRGDASTSPRERFLRMSVRYVTYAVEHESHYQLMFGSAIADFNRYPSLKEVSARGYETLLATIVAGQEARLFQSRDPRQLALACWSLAHGQAMLLINQRLKFMGFAAGQTRRIAATMAHVIAEGLDRRHRR